MIDHREWATWVGKGELPSTIGLQLNGSDPTVGRSVEAGFEVLNRGFRHFAAVSKDPALSPGERARALAQGQTFINGQLTTAVNAARREMDALATRASRERESFVKGSISDDLAVALAIQIRTLGKSVIGSDQRFAQAIARVPPAIAGLTPEDVTMYVDDSIQRHAPELAALVRSVDLSRATVRRLEQTAMHLAAELDKSLDRDALKRDSEFRSLLG